MSKFFQAFSLKCVLFFVVAIFISGGIAFYLGRSFEKSTYNDACLDLGGGMQPGHYPICVIKKESAPQPTTVPTTNPNNQKQVKESESANSEIYLEAEEGQLTSAGEYTHIAPSTRGGENADEVYLGDGGASLTLTFPVDDNQAGKYLLKLRLFDDGKHPDGSRDATITINGKTYHYNHVSQDLGGWRWVELGEVTLKPGENKISLTKDETTSAAFIIDAFGFVPVE